MFGYVIPDRAALSPEAQSRYRSAYCGLCRRIDALHGLRGRFSLSYDLTFLNILLCSLYEGETPADSGIDRCPVHPVHGVLWRSADPTDYCADLSVALHYYNAQDKWQDDHNLLALGYSALLDNSTAEAAQRWPRMAELFDYRQDRWAPELRSIGFHLGKFIYLLDAYDDLPRDKRRGAYNPLRELSTHPDYEEEMLDIFELLLARCAQNFERLPCVEDADLLRNILYSGVWLKYNCKNAKRTGKPDAS